MNADCPSSSSLKGNENDVRNPPTAMPMVVVKANENGLDVDSAMVNENASETDSRQDFPDATTSNRSQLNRRSAHHEIEADVQSAFRRPAREVKERFAKKGRKTHVSNDERISTQSFIGRNDEFHLTFDRQFSKFFSCLRLIIVALHRRGNRVRSDRTRETRRTRRSSAEGKSREILIVKEKFSRYPLATAGDFARFGLVVRPLEIVVFRALRAFFAPPNSMNDGLTVNSKLGETPGKSIVRFKSK